jgi:hypothetical protein
MKLLFDEDYRWTPAAQSIENEANLKKIFTKWVNEQGYSPREVALVLHTAVTDAMCENILGG